MRPSTCWTTPSSRRRMRPSCLRGSRRWGDLASMQAFRQCWQCWQCSLWPRGGALPMLRLFHASCLMPRAPPHVEALHLPHLHRSTPRSTGACRSASSSQSIRWPRGGSGGLGALGMAPRVGWVPACCPCCTAPREPG